MTRAPRPIQRAGADAGGARIRAFWERWEAVRPDIELSLSHQPKRLTRAVDEVERAVRELHPHLDWKLDDRPDGSCALTLSPLGEPELRQLTQRWVEAAPATL